MRNSRVPPIHLCVSGMCISANGESKMKGSKIEWEVTKYFATFLSRQ